MKIVWTGKLFEVAHAEMHRRNMEVAAYGPRDLVNEDSFVAALSGCEIYVNGGFEAASERVLRNTPTLRLIIYLGADAASYVDLPTAKSLGILVCNTPGANAKSVAEVAIGLAVLAARRMVHAVVSDQSESWRYETVHALYGMQIGLLGMGHIAEAFAQFLRLGLGADVSYWSRSRKPEIEERLGIRFRQKDDLFANSDLISLHLPQDAGIVVGPGEFQTMKAGAVLINTARSQLVDASAMYHALSSRKLAFAAFDGYYGEGTRPLSDIEHKILDLGPERFVATAHIGWRTFEADRQAQAEAMRSIAEFLDGKAISNRIA